ncbi:MAG: hypothetical protein AAF802_27510 [Planctomycetota bacterium]
MSVYEQLISGLEDPDFVTFFQQKCRSWVAFYRGITKQILELELPELRSRITKYDRQLFGRDSGGNPVTTMQHAVFRVEEKLRLKSENQQYEGFTRQDLKMLYVIRGAKETQDHCEQLILSNCEDVAQIEEDPNYTLATRIDPRGSIVTMDDLRLDTKCVITALWIRQKSGRTDLLVSNPSQLELDGTGECRLLLMLAALDDQIGRERDRDHLKLEEIAKCCIREFRQLPSVNDADDETSLMTLKRLIEKMNPSGATSGLGCAHQLRFCMRVPATRIRLCYR